MRTRPFEIPEALSQEVERATILDLLETGEIVVRVNRGPARRVHCEFLQTAVNDRPVLREGDQVLVLLPGTPRGKGCVLGRIGVYEQPDRKHVVLDADEEITIRCGPGSITIRKNGKVLVKGLEIVSHAKGAHRIRGGSIELN